MICPFLPFALFISLALSWPWSSVQARKNSDCSDAYRHTTTPCWPTTWSAPRWEQIFLSSCEWKLYSIWAQFHLILDIDHMQILGSHSCWLSSIWNRILEKREKNFQQKASTLHIEDEKTHNFIESLRHYSVIGYKYYCNLFNLWRLQ